MYNWERSSLTSWYTRAEPASLSSCWLKPPVSTVIQAIPAACAEPLDVPRHAVAYCERPPGVNGCIFHRCHEYFGIRFGLRNLVSSRLPIDCVVGIQGLSQLSEFGAGAEVASETTRPSSWT